MAATLIKASSSALTSSGTPATRYVRARAPSSARRAPGVRLWRSALILTMAALTAGLFPGVASAGIGAVIPPGNSAESQYVESIPSAVGSTPSKLMATGRGSGPSGTGLRTEPSAGISLSTRLALRREGSAGIQTVRLAQSLMPSRRPRPASVSSGPGLLSMKSSRTVSHSSVGGPVFALVGALFGASGPLGGFVPLVMIFSTVAGGVVLVRRRNR